MRVHELAKELKITSKELISILAGRGVAAKNHMALVEDKMVQELLKGGVKEAESKPSAAVLEKTPAEKKIQPEAVSPKKEEKVQTETKKQSQSSAPPIKKEESPKLVQPVEVAAEKAKIIVEPPKEKESVKIEMPITVGTLAEKLNVRVAELIKALIGLGIFANVNQLLNEEIIRKVAYALGVKIEKLEDDIAKAVLSEGDDRPEDLVKRPPIVTMMGHVDHGKTSLLDAIRSTNVADREVGRITQHIGAYGVDIPGKGHVTFLDTPGHAAFTAMRARGAHVTDVVVLVVAADDGVMPQTQEAIDHARAANSPIVVAMNKCDLPTANPTKVMGELQKLDLMPEEWGGKTICVKVSAKTGKGIEELLELLLLEAEILELKANPNRPAQGVVVEARLTKGKGNVATVIVQRGTLRIGDMLVIGQFYGKVRAMMSDRGKTVKEAGPSHAVEVLGLPGTPEAGETFSVVADEKIARKISEKRALEIREKAITGVHAKHMSLENLYGKLKEGQVKELKLIVKADVQGSIEALARSLEQAVSDKISVRILHGGVGGINESDIMLAAASDAIVIGFHVRADENANRLSELEGVDVRFYNIIYEAIDDVRKAMEGLLEPTLKEVVESRTLIRQVFSSSKIGTIGGAYVQKGKLARNHKIRVIRDNIIIHQGKLASLKRFKDDVREVQEGYDCGVVVEGYNLLQADDIIESYRVDKIASKLK
ncbi:MAG: hypothetical protein A3G33_07370 [Omnitrophica bacterium RIFCSPLOWO2_12_FULL_44_17]|uniref:Translation initiation factor IF-2 n=1 Tax=Candidatus Danuiimicrobium aquiferis TaxID=1801832 RepID=A0A1G1KYW8_9BACT|nr:MAG: hypothetical protein A3B72_07670 [Omnitrophica bacterium RIFCSPHIGHO2_02_FULL_45_28]OGW89244.1 MAG: hypothetical protein A3E74_08345 [Omnitrophica bacterium RIFCSPHIGHO2_12_FULL_44_12]OGW98043.1 MAG: hypothetical protein A3G33_07370 [Omnitrophica bacterium RIFCSPLOWO2_12_FULL_44_17]OGX03513.1 MAG: hypothetical protein A3J12_02860 [Omnitrophica bacterium RIFCSPLOWO2_02_FULL_44_11]